MTCGFVHVLLEADGNYIYVAEAVGLRTRSQEVE